MSDNKYIIDKDSLTGIADAVRDKLGTGDKATIDETTGEIVYPEGKGYYLKENLVAKISGFKWSETGYNGNFSRSYSPRIDDTDWNAAVGEPWYSAEITLINVSGRYYDMTVFYSSNNYQIFTNVRSSTYTASAPNGSTYFSLSFGNSYNPSVYNGSSSLGSLIVVFKDAEGKPIKPKQSSYRYLWLYGGNYGTYNFGTEDVPTPIPFSIDDIQDKITNYLGKKSSLIYRYHINPQNNESGTAFAGSPLSEMNVLDYGVTSVSQIKLMLAVGSMSSNSFTWYPANYTYTMIINGKPFYGSDGNNVYWPDWTSDNRYSSYKLQLCPSKLSSWPLGIMRGTTSSYMAETSLQSPRIVFMVLDLEAT